MSFCDEFRKCNEVWVLYEPITYHHNARSCKPGFNMGLVSGGGKPAAPAT